MSFNRNLDKVTINGTEYSLNGRSECEIIGQCQYVVAVDPDGIDGEVQTQIYIESVDAEYGDDETTMYRWVENDDNGSHESGDWTLSREEAVEAGRKFAASNQESL
jgi:hypothetical protein